MDFCFKMNDALACMVGMSGRTPEELAAAMYAAGGEFDATDDCFGARIGDILTWGGWEDLTLVDLAEAVGISPTPEACTVIAELVILGTDECPECGAAEGVEVSRLVLHEAAATHDNPAEYEAAVRKRCPHCGHIYRIVESSK